MTFANPIAWYLLFLAIPIIFFYILKIRLRRQPVSTTIFWQQVFEEKRSRSFWRRLRHLISLLFSLAFLFLLVAAVLNPLSGTQTKPSRCVIILDNSAGMNALLAPGGSSRLEAARKELRQLLTTTDLARQTALLTAGGRPKIVAGFTDHLGTLRKAIESVEPTDSPTALSETIALARQLTASENTASILVYTDKEPDAQRYSAQLPDSPNIQIFPIGSPIDNIAITRFQPRRSLTDMVGYEILVEMANFGLEPIQARLEIDLDGRVIDVIPLTLEPNRLHTEIVRDTTPQGGLLRGVLTASDSTDLFPLDNTAVAFLPERPTQPIYFYGEDDFFLQQVLLSQPNVELHRLAELPDWNSNPLPDAAVLVLHRVVPEKIPPGNVLIIDPRSSCDLFDVEEPLEMPIVAEEKSDSPLLRFVHLRNLLVPGARQMNLKVEGSVLAETPEASPIYVHWEMQNIQQNILALTVDLKRGDLALRTAFPIMISQALNAFRGRGGELEKAYSTGEAVRLPIQTQHETVELVSPSGRRQTFPVKSGTVTLGMLPECGVWQVFEQNSEKSLVRIACNLSNAAESNLRKTPESFYERRPNTASIQRSGRPIWFWLAAVALLFTTFEWFLYQRRWID